MTNKLSHARSDVRALVVGLTFAIAVLAWFSWNSWRNLERDKVIAPTAPTESHGH